LKKAKLVAIGASITIYYCRCNFRWIFRNDLTEFNILLSESDYNVENDQNNYKNFKSEINRKITNGKMDLKIIYNYLD
jgi:hypothetical protein